LLVIRTFASREGGPCASGRTDFAAAPDESPCAPALGDAGGHHGRAKRSPNRCRTTNSTSASPGRGRTKTIRSGSRQGPLAPWVAATASSATAATQGHHGHPGAAVLARFSGSVGTLSPNDDCCQGLTKPGTLAEVALDLLSFRERQGEHSLSLFSTRTERGQEHSYAQSKGDVDRMLPPFNCVLHSSSIS